MNRRGYAVFIDTLCQGPVPSVTEIYPADSDNATGLICVFPTELEVVEHRTSNAQHRTSK